MFLCSAMVSPLAFAQSFTTETITFSEGTSHQLGGAIALNPTNNRPGVAFVYATSSISASLKFVERGVSGWGSPETVFNFPMTTWGCWWGLSLAYDSSGNPGIAFSYAWVAGDSRFHQMVRWTKRTSGVWSSPETRLERILPDETTLISGDLYRNFVSAQFDSSDNVYIAFTDNWEKYSYNPDEEWPARTVRCHCKISGTWQTEQVIESEADGLCSDISLQVDPNSSAGYERARIAYTIHDGEGSGTGVVKFTFYSSSTWTKEEVDEVGTTWHPDWDQRVSLKLDPNDSLKPWIAYENGEDTNLAKRTGTNTWSTQVIINSDDEVTITELGELALDTRTSTTSPIVSTTEFEGFIIRVVTNTGLSEDIENYGPNMWRVGVVFNATDKITSVVAIKEIEDEEEELVPAAVEFRLDEM
jgi:hypothetical protein